MPALLRDIRAEANGIPLTLTRTYDSTQRDQSGDFGWGWRAAAQDLGLRKNMVLGLDWAVVKQGLENCLRPSGQRRVTISLPDGGIYRFKAKNLNECGGIGGALPEVSIVYDALPLPVGGGSGQGSGVAQLEVVMTELVQARGGHLINEEGAPWNPSDYKLTTAEGTIYHLREGVGILRITDVYGNTAMVDASGRRTEYEYDANGNRTKVTTAAGTAQARSTTTTYDALNRATRIEQPDGSAHSVVFRADGRKASETDPRGVTSSYAYDATGRLVSVTQSGVATATTYAYDQTGAKTTQTDAKNHKVSWEFDAGGRPTSRTLPDGQKETFEYDLQGQLTARTTFGGQRITFSYDSAGRQTSQIIAATASTPARAIQFTYNADGQRASHVESGATSANGQTSYSYDAQGRLVQMSTPQGTLGWAYDAAGRITERSTAEGTTRYQYDGDGRLQTLTAPDGKTTSYAYDASGRNTRSEQQLSGADKLVTERRYDTADRQIAIAHSKQSTSGTTLIAGQAITRGQGGAVSRIDTFDATASFSAATGAFSGNPTRVQTFGYDANARLQSEREYKGADIAALQANANAPATHATTYGYDAVGNRTSKTVTTSAGTESTSYLYDTNDRLTSETLNTATGSTVTTTYTWDGNGNLASKTTPSEHTAYVFDADNRLIEVKRGASSSDASTVAKYGYDADGQRVRKETASGITNYLIDPTTTWPQVVLETKGTQRTAYTWGDQLRQQARGTAGSANSAPTEALIPLHGHLGTTIAAIDPGGNAVERYEGSAFGEEPNQSPKANHQYTGEYWEPEARLTYLRARWYEPATGRMPSVDPAMGRMADARSLNRYAYADGDAVNNVDPSGRVSMIDVTSSLNIQSIVKAYNVASFAVDLYSGGLSGGARAIAEEIVFGKLSKFRPIAKISDQIIGLFSKVWSRGVHLKLGLTYNSSHLKHNLEQLFGPLPANHAAHHIVPSTSPAMQKLRQFGIDPNSPSNGVALPRSSGVGISAQHSGGHCQQYYRFVERLVMGASDKADVVNALALVRQELLSGAAVVQGCT
jgi:RHS repeat-associated protein